MVPPRIGKKLEVAFGGAAAMMAILAMTCIVATNMMNSWLQHTPMTRTKSISGMSEEASRSSSGMAGASRNSLAGDESSDHLDR